MNCELLKVALRQRALFLPSAPSAPQGTTSGLSSATLAFVAELRQLGYTLSEESLRAVDALSDADRQVLLDVVNDVMGTHLNWASLVRGWLLPTGESWWDHFVTLIANVLRAQGDAADMAGTTLPCGHFIPDGTFPLERYNGCPFCGMPFHTADFVYRGQGTKLKVLQLWGNAEMEALFRDLLLSPVPLDASQRESLKTLLRCLPSSNSHLPTSIFQLSSSISQKETRMLVIDALVEHGHDDEAATFFDTPNDVLRYLWYRHTGHVQLLQPKTILHTARKNHRYEWNTEADINHHLSEVRQQLRLKYDRRWCRRVARWLNTLVTSHPSPLTSHPSPLTSHPSPLTSHLSPLTPHLESMHPKREMWVRFIRALRLAEYARRPGFEALAQLLDCFYRRDYEVWQGRVNHYRLKGDADETLRLLQQRPGLFARCLFSTMLTFGPEPVIEAFRSVLPKLPVRLLLTLGAQADLWFDPAQQRVARPLGSVMRQVPPHPLLAHYSARQLSDMQQAVRQLYLDAMRQHFAAHKPSQSATIYIEPELFDIPISVGDRSATVQDVSAALQGTRFPVSGDSVRLFLQWGQGLPAQHLDMDLSCHILTDADSYVCAYYNLAPAGARHSGDIQHIPDQVGTAEYIELSLPELEKSGARRVVFTCNAYTAGALSPNLMVGWMSADVPMTVSNETGVAYDPSTVDHLVRITEGNLSKGLIFGVLEVARREITWLEMPFDGQTVQSISPQTVDAYLRRLRHKPTIGQLLLLKAEAQGLTLVTDSPDGADEVYTLLWAQNSAAVSQLLLG